MNLKSGFITSKVWNRGSKGNSGARNVFSSMKNGPLSLGRVKARPSVQVAQAHLSVY